MIGEVKSVDGAPLNATTAQNFFVFSNAKRSPKTRFESPRVRFWVVFLLVAATAAATFGTLGCSGGRRRLFHRRADESIDSSTPVRSLSEAETILTVEGRVERLQIAPNSKRVLVERRDFTAPTANERSVFYRSNGGDAQTFDAPRSLDYFDKTVFELWNVEYVDSRIEPLGDVDGADATLAAATPEATTFDEKGERVFWTARELDSQNSESSRTILATRALETAFSFADVADSPPFRLKTASEAKKAASVWLSPNARWLVCRGEIDQLVDETKENATLKANAQAPDVLAPAPPSSASGASGKITLASGTESPPPDKATSDAVRASDQETACFLVSRIDRRRVVRFPNVVKMTFDSSTSDETIEGRVVETLAVSNAGDLVATLVEENPPKSESNPQRKAPATPSLTADSRGDVLAGASVSDAPNTQEKLILPNLTPPQFVSRGFSPRYKIVIWDLSVAEKVDWDKARKPLRALEVAQISILAPVSRHFCKFSPNGRIFAARLEPRYISLWQAANGRFLTELGEHKNDVDDFAFSPTGMKIAAGCGGKNARVVLWDVRKGSANRMLDDFSEGVTAIDAVAYSPDGNYLYFANSFGEIKRWEIRLTNKTAAP